MDVFRLIRGFGRMGRWRKAVATGVRGGEEIVSNLLNASGTMAILIGIRERKIIELASDFWLFSELEYFRAIYIYICIERKRFLLKVSSIIISVGGGIDNARDTYTNSMQFSPGKIGEWNGGKKASRGKITSRTGSRRARFLVYSRLNYSTRKGISSETKRFLWNSNGRVITSSP